MDKIPDKILNKNLYIKVRDKIYKDIPKHSAYRSMIIIKEYQKQGGKIKKKLEEKSGLTIWIREKWINLTPYAEGIINSIDKSPKCGERHPKQKGPSVCRPSIKINKDTPIIAKNYTKKQIQKAVKIKSSGKRIEWSKL